MHFNSPDLIHLKSQTENIKIHVVSEVQNPTLNQKTLFIPKEITYITAA